MCPEILRLILKQRINLGGKRNTSEERVTRGKVKGSHGNGRETHHSFLEKGEQARYLYPFVLSAYAKMLKWKRKYKY